MTAEKVTVKGKHMSDEFVESQLLRCASDFNHFCDNYVKIRKEGEVVPFKMHDFQKRYVLAAESHRLVVGVKFRRGGFTAASMARLLWRFLFKLDENNMAVARGDRQALWCGDHFYTMFDNLPDWLKPKLKKRNSHEIVSEETGNSLSFYALEASCGKRIDNLYIDEPGFIRNMDSHWKALWPTLSAGGSCLATGTPNGTKGWFYETVKGAAERTNDFFLYTAEYHENPDYEGDQWEACTRKGIGDRGFRQEFLCEFLDPLSLDDRAKRAEDFLVDVTAAEEVAFLDNAKRKADERRLNEEPVHNPFKNDPSWDIYPGRERGLLFEDDDEHTSRVMSEWVYEDEVVGKVECVSEKSRPEVIQFERLTREQTRSRFESEQKANFKRIDHPEFVPDVFNDIDGMAEMYDALGDDSWKRALEKRRREERRREERLHDYLHPDSFVLCGLGVADVPADRPDRELIRRLTEGGCFPDNINFEFFDGRLCVNEVPTTIREDDVADLYNGFSALSSRAEAIDTAVSLLKRKLAPLFGLEEKSAEPLQEDRLLA